MNTVFHGTSIILYNHQLSIGHRWLCILTLMYRDDLCSHLTYLWDFVVYGTKQNRSIWRMVKCRSTRLSNRLVYSSRIVINCPSVTFYLLYYNNQHTFLFFLCVCYCSYTELKTHCVLLRRAVVCLVSYNLHRVESADSFWQSNKRYTCRLSEKYSSKTSFSRHYPPTTFYNLSLRGTSSFQFVEVCRRFASWMQNKNIYTPMNITKHNNIV